MRVHNVLAEATAPRRGVKPSYTEYHVLKMLLVLSSNAPLGRHALSRALGISERSVRTLIKRLRELHVVDVDAVGGVLLTDEGRGLVEEFKRGVSCVIKLDVEPLKRLALDEYAYAAVIALEDLAVEVTAKPMTWRDSMVRYGASAALVVAVVEGKPLIPLGGGRCLTTMDYPELADVVDHLKPPRNSVILIAFAERPEEAEEALYKTVIDLTSQCR